MSLNCSEAQEFIGRIRIQAIMKPFVLSTSSCQAIFPITNCPLHSANELYFQFFKKKKDVQSYLVVNFDTAKQLRLNFAGLMSIHFLSRIGFRIQPKPLSRLGWFEISKSCVFSTCHLHDLRSFFNRNEELSFHIFL